MLPIIIGVANIIKTTSSTDCSMDFRINSITGRPMLTPQDYDDLYNGIYTGHQAFIATIEREIESPNYSTVCEKLEEAAVELVANDNTLATSLGSGKLSSESISDTIAQSAWIDCVDYAMTYITEMSYMQQFMLGTVATAGFFSNLLYYL